MRTNSKFIGWMVLCLFTFCLTSCVERYTSIRWIGDDFVSYEGGTAVWVVNKKHVNVTPQIRGINAVVTNKDYEKVEQKRLPIIADNYSYSWDWIQIDIMTNRIEFTFQPNETEYTRDIIIWFDDGSVGWNRISVYQPYKPTDTGL